MLDLGAREEFGPAVIDLCPPPSVRRQAEVQKAVDAVDREPHEDDGRRSHHEQHRKG
ncbi:hypothetical protein [Mycobacterium kubicae]|uniref:hypothetical protein n=1 Tax=Mycobacterium kubicae TaxID=120959 RepID=UPI00163EED45|nr:hypothetical protein [Mycobacterium kubicae]